jgi:hypothetical protein
LPRRRSAGRARARQRCCSDCSAIDPSLIEEWAELAVKHNVRVDGATAPLVLDWGARQRRPPRGFAALGHRGTWLASLNADWQKHVAG